MGEVCRLLLAIGGNCRICRIGNHCTSSPRLFPLSAYILVPFLISVYVFDNKLHRHTHGRHRVETRLLTLEHIPTNDIHYLADRIARQVAYSVPPRSVKDKTIILLIHCFDVKKRPRGGCDISRYAAVFPTFGGRQLRMSYVIGSVTLRPSLPPYQPTCAR